MTRVAQIFRQRSGVLLVVDQYAGFQPPHHGENIEVRVYDGDDRRSQHEDGERDGVRGHVAPVEHADEGLAIEDRLVEAEQGRAAHHRHADPREDHPALTSRFRLYGLVPQWFPAKTAWNTSVVVADIKIEKLSKEKLPNVVR